LPDSAPPRAATAASPVVAVTLPLTLASETTSACSCADTSPLIWLPAKSSTLPASDVIFSVTSPVRAAT
jgi:hypothetical protein